MNRYTNFGSFVQRTEFLNEMRKVEIEDAPANTIIAHSLSPMPPQATPPPGAQAAREVAALDADTALESGSVAGVVG